MPMGVGELRGRSHFRGALGMRLRFAGAEEVAAAEEVVAAAEEVVAAAEGLAGTNPDDAATVVVPGVYIVEVVVTT